MLVDTDKVVKKSVIWEGINYDLCKDGTLYMTLSSNIENNLRLYESILSMKPKKIIIRNVRDLEILKTLIKKIKFFNIDMEIDLLYNSINPIIKGLNNNLVVNIDKIPDTLKIRGFNQNNEQTEFTTWTHNLSEENKLRFIKHLVEEDKSIFLKQEKAIKEIYKLIKSYYPNIDKLPRKDAFELISHIISKINLNKYEKYLKTNKELEHGYMANLLTLFTNNNLFSINCINSKGSYLGKHIIWNEVIDEDGEVSGYDIENNKYNEDILHNSDYTYYRVYPILLELKKGYFKNNIDNGPIRINKKVNM